MSKHITDADGHRKDLKQDDAAFLKQFNSCADNLMVILQSVELKKEYWFISACILSLKGLIRIVNTQIGLKD